MKEAFSLISTLVASASLLAGCTVQGERRYALDQMPAETVRYNHLDAEEYAERYPAQDGVYLYRESLLELVEYGYSVSSRPSTCQLWQGEAMRYMILEPEVQGLTTFDLRLERGISLAGAYVTLIHPDGRIEQFNSADLHQEPESQGSVRYTLAYPGAVRGTIVDVGYETFQDPVLTGGYHFSTPLQFSMPCERRHVRIVHPDGWNVRIGDGLSEESGWKESMERSVDNGLVAVRYDAYDIPSLPYEPYSPYRGERLRLFEAALVEERGSPIRGTWQRFAEKVRISLLDPWSPHKWEIRQLVPTIVDPDADEQARLQEILSWASDNIRYYRSSSPTSYNPIAVLDNGKGTTVEINTLVGLMLESADFDVEYILVHSAFDRPVQDSFVAPDLFYTPGLSVRTGDSNLYIFPWIRNYPTGQIPSYLQGQQMLVMNRKKFLRIDTLPRTALTRSLTSDDYQVKVATDGRIEVVETRRMEGDAGFTFRRSIENLDSGELRERMIEEIVYEGTGLDFDRFEIDDRDEFDAPLVIRLYYSIDGLITESSDEVIVRLDEVLFPSFRYERKADLINRVNPIRIYNDVDVFKKVVLSVPSDWKVNALPKLFSDSTSFGKASANYEFESGELRIEYHRSLRSAERPAEDFEELLRLIDSRVRMDLPPLVFLRP